MHHVMVYLQEKCYEENKKLWKITAYVLSIPHPPTGGGIERSTFPVWNGGC